MVIYPMLLRSVVISHHHFFQLLMMNQEGTSQIGVLWLIRLGQLILVLGYARVVVSFFFVICAHDFSTPHCPSCNTSASLSMSSFALP
jgi:hypothetical protein